MNTKKLRELMVEWGAELPPLLRANMTQKAFTVKDAIRLAEVLLEAPETPETTANPQRGPTPAENAEWIETAVSTALGTGVISNERQAEWLKMMFHVATRNGKAEAAEERGKDASPARWEVGFRRIVDILGLTNEGFEIGQVVKSVEAHVNVSQQALKAHSLQSTAPEDG